MIEISHLAYICLLNYNLQTSQGNAHLLDAHV